MSAKIHWAERVSMTLSNLIFAYMQTESIFPELGGTYGLTDNDVVEVLKHVTLYNQRTDNVPLLATLVCSGTPEGNAMDACYGGPLGLADRRAKRAIAAPDEEKSWHLFIRPAGADPILTPEQLKRAVEFLDNLCHKRNELVSYIKEKYSKK